MWKVKKQIEQYIEDIPLCYKQDRYTQFSIHFTSSRRQSGALCIDVYVHSSYPNINVIEYDVKL